MFAGPSALLAWDPAGHLTTVRAGSTHRRKAVVVSPLAERRDGWAAVVADERTDVITCVGPSAGCPLVNGADSCPLVASSDLVLYDADATPLPLLAGLLRSHPGTEIVLVRDRMVRGQHRPSVVLRQFAR